MINNLSDVEKSTKIVSTDKDLPAKAIFGTMSLVINYKEKGSTVVIFNGTEWVEL